MYNLHDSCLSHYLAQIAHYPLLTEEQEAEADRTTLITHHLKLAVHISRHYARRIDDLLDCIQDANIGLIRAADTFDGSKSRFSTWAALHIKSAIRNASRDSLGKRSGRRPSGAAPPSVSLDQTAERDDSVSDADIGYGRDEFDMLRSEDDTERDVIRQKQLEYAARRLTTKQLHVMTQRLLGETFQEIADAQDTTHQAIQSLQRSAMRTLRHAE